MVRMDEHAYIKIGKDIKTGNIPGLVVLQGAEEYLVHFYAGVLCRKYVNDASKSLDIVELDRDVFTVDDVIENLETISLLSERKVVIIRDFIDGKGKYPKNLQNKSAGFKAFAEYTASIPEGSLLIVTLAKQLDDSAASRRLISDFDSAVSGRVYDFSPLDPAQLRAFIEKRFRNAGKVYKSSLIEGILRYCGYGNKNIDYGLYDLENDLKKIIAHCGANQEITSDDVVGVMTSNPENNIFGMMDAIGRNHKDKALQLLHNLLEDGTGEFQILSLLTSQLELMLITREMNDDGMSLRAIQDELYRSDRTNKYRVESALRSAKNFRTDDLRRILSSAYDIDMNIKSGLFSGPLALEMFIAGV